MSKRQKAAVGRPKKLVGEVHKQITLIPAETIEGLDEWVSDLKEQNAGMSGITRADLIRDILARAIKARRKTAKR